MVHVFRVVARSSTPPRRIRARNRRDESGSSLLEVIIAVALVAMVVLGLATAFITLMRINRANAEQQRVDHAVDNVAEQLKAVPYVDCAGAAHFRAQIVVPTGANDPEVVIPDGGITYRDPSNDTFRSTCATDGGTQRITIEGEFRGRTRVAQVVVRNR